MGDDTSMMRAGIVGAGFMAATHARAVRSAGGTVVAAVASVPEGRERAVRVTGAVHGLGTVEELLNRSDVDVVHVCTPNMTHEGFALAAIENGKHVVCEKPLATTASAAHRLVAAVAEHGTVGTVPFVYRFHPMVREMRDRVAAGVLGIPSVVHGSYLQDWLADASATNWRVDATQGGRSRAFADIGSHWFDLFEFILGDPVQALSAQLSTVVERRGDGHPVDTEDAASVQFRTRAGLLGVAVIAQVAAGRRNRLHLEISGTSSSLGFDQERAEELWVGRADAALDVRRDPALLSEDAARLSFLPPGHPQGYQDAFNAFVADSYATMRGSQRPGLPTFADGHRASIICDAVLRSGDEHGAWIEIDQPQDGG